MENLATDKSFWKSKNVLVTGHTGFKGGWLCLWLNLLGANVDGFSLKPKKENEFYLKVFKDRFPGEEKFSDINDIKALSGFIKSQRPEIIFHLAAQPLVRYSYLNPIDTFKTNIMGVINIMEVARKASQKPVIINVTTDKVYENQEWIWAYRENEKLGGNDPYSASKACSEIVTNSYIKSFFKGSGIKVATARAGNVIGGGDMSIDRLIPDYFRSLQMNEPLTIRNPLATRPWQHVLEPVSGYIKLAENLSLDNDEKFCGAWNFGPLGDAISVGEVINRLIAITGGKPFQLDDNFNPHEAQSLMLDSTKARKLLGWYPKLSIDEALTLTYQWFQQAQSGSDLLKLSLQQISEFEQNVAI